MVRVLKCHSFASQHVIPINKEPLTVCADNDKVFVATSDCEIIVFKVSDGASTELQRCPTISQVEKIVYNSFKNYIVTVELKKSWKKTTKSVRVYLKWDMKSGGGTKLRTKVRVAGKSHVQHVSSTSSGDQMEIVEVPQDGNATSVAVCKYTGNFAVACGSEVKLCSVVEKTVANSDKTYLDVEVFLELCWSFPVVYISLCEEFVVCCSNREVQAIRVRYDEGEIKPVRKFLNSPSTSLGSGGRLASSSYQDVSDASGLSSGAGTPHSYVSETFMFSDQVRGERTVTFSPFGTDDGSQCKASARKSSDLHGPAKEFSMVGMRPSKHSPKMTNTNIQLTTASHTNDDNLVEWNFHEAAASAGNLSVCLPGLHTSPMQSHCHHHAHIISPPVLSDFSGGNVKSSSGVQAETVLHLNDPQEKEEWMNIVLIPTFSGALSAPLRIPSVCSDRMRSVSSAIRTSMCCYISGNRGGYLYQLSPLLTRVSTYKYTNAASQVGVSHSHLHIVTSSGIETYTARWGAVSLEMQEKDDDESGVEKIHPSSSLDICLCGHQPFLGAVTLSIGTDFLALLSKVEDPSGTEEAQWSLYILHSFSLVDDYKDMITFAQHIQSTGPASYIHILQEAHLLLCTHPIHTVVSDVEVKDCLRQVCRLLAEFYSQPGQEDWALCWPYFHSAGTPVEDIVETALQSTHQRSPCEFGQGILDCLDHILFSHEEYVNPSVATSDTILKIYAVSAPEKLSRVILLSNMKNFSAEKAFHHLKTWLSVKSSAAQPISAVDKLAIVQLQLSMCEVESACTELKSINRPSLTSLCSSHPALIHENLSAFTPLAQLMRQHMSGILLDILVDMLDKCVLSLDSLLILLKSQNQADLPCNNHVREVLELVLSDEKRIFLFEETVQMLCEIYISKITSKDLVSLRQLNVLSHQKFALPQGNGHFAPRFGWLDYIPPFQGPQQMMKPCQRMEVKQIPGQGSRMATFPVAMVNKQTGHEKCQCCWCNESLLKLQSLLCSPRLTSELANYVLEHIEHPREEGNKDGKESDACWDCVQLLCLRRLDKETAIDLVVNRYPSISGLFAGTCFNGNVDQYAYLMRSLEKVMKTCAASDGDQQEETVYVNAYKDLLTRMAELFPPAEFISLLPEDGSLYFLLPYIRSSMELQHLDKLKQKIVDMGKDLISQI